MKVKNNFSIFQLFFIYVFITFCFINEDVGPEQPARMSPIVRRVTLQFDVTSYEEGSNNEEEIARNLKGLTHSIPEYAWVRDIPS